MRFVNRWNGPSPAGLPAVRAWLRRPDLLRVERLDGTLDLVVREERPRSAGMALTVDGGRPLPPRPLPGAVRPVYDVDGLVEQRPEDVDCDDPMYQSYDWVAMLDPVELSAGVALEAVREVSHRGRPAWEAVAHPGVGYDPRCSCCPLLPSAESDRLEAEGGGLTMRDHDPGLLYAEAHRVRLDVETGVCVLTEEVGGTRAGYGHDVEIEAVDEPMADHLFISPRRGPLQRPRRP